MGSDKLEYTIIGHDIQMVEITLESGKSVIAEAGTMTYMEEDIDFQTIAGDGSGGIMGKLFKMGKRMLTGESIFLTRFENEGRNKRRVAFAAPFPGSIIDLDLAYFGNEVICQKDSFVAAALGIEVDIKFQKKLGTGFFGGEGFVLQRLRGDGIAFIHAGGTVIEKKLNDETVRLDTGCLVGFSGDIDYGVKLSGGLKSMIFGGEGLFLATLSGTGTIWIQSLPFSRLADRILAQSLIGEQGED